MRSPMLTMLHRLVATALLAAALVAHPPRADAADAPAQVTKRPAGARVLPEKFLRRWDPITVFFDQDAGPAQGGAEDHPEKYFTLAPAHPGAATWINARTLQFKPAEPWPPLTRFTLQIGSHSEALATLMSAPSATTPGDGATGLDEIGAQAQLIDVAAADHIDLDNPSARRAERAISTASRPRCEPRRPSGSMS